MIIHHSLSYGDLGKSLEAGCSMSEEDIQDMLWDQPSHSRQYPQNAPLGYDAGYNVQFTGFQLQVRLTLGNKFEEVKQ
jgi:hypothetical protein